jgi:hypothetical protein
MALRIEWRTRGEFDDAIFVVGEDGHTVRQALTADPDVLTDLLNNMVALDAWGGGQPVDEDPSFFGTAFMSGFGPRAWTPMQGDGTVLRSEGYRVHAIDVFRSRQCCLNDAR